jgi:hypothetical protein
LYRYAKVEDHDDLLPVLAQVAADANAPGGPLSRLPVSLTAGGAGTQFALARLIDDALRDPEGSCVLVAEAGDTGKLVGVMALSAGEEDVDAPGLAAAYDLSAYDDLAEPFEEPVVEVPVPVREPTPEPEPAAAEPATDAAAADAAAPAGEAAAVVEGEAAAAPEGEEAAPAADAAPEGEAAAADPTPEGDTAAAPAPEEADPPAAPTPEPEPAAPSEPVIAAPPKPLAFRVSMLCVAAAYETQSADFLEYAFEAFPDKDFAILTLPPASPELPLAKVGKYL